MDIKTRLGEDIIFPKKFRGITSVETLNEKGIFTVEDFINCDVELISSSKQQSTQFRAFQDLFKSYYLGQSLIREPILENEYGIDDLDNYLNDIEKLGYVTRGGYYSGIFKAMLSGQSTVKMVEILRANIPQDKSVSKVGFLNELYVNYYDEKQKEKQASAEQEIDSLITLKNELVSLLNQRNMLDTKIASLLEQINTLEGGKTNNARK